MVMRLRRRDPLVPGTYAAPAAPATRGSAILRTLRTAWWPRFLVAGVVIAIVGVTLLSGMAQALATLGGAAIAVLAATAGLLGKSWDRDRWREPPMPPGGGAPIENLLAVPAEAAVEQGITLYDVLGVLPGAEARKIKREYEAKSDLLGPDMIAGAPPNVVTACTRAQDMLDIAWRVLSDPMSRGRYDEAAGIRRSGGGLGQPGTGPADPRLDPDDMNIIVEERGAGAAGGLLVWFGRLVRKPPSRRVTVPDVRGLFYHVCLEVAWRHGMTLTAIRLTEHPMAVDGLVVDQDPPPGAVRCGGQLTVQVWHPSAR
jgi:DnaJ domain